MPLAFAYPSLHQALRRFAYALGLDHALVAEAAASLLNNDDASFSRSFLANYSATSFDEGLENHADQDGGDSPHDFLLQSKSLGLTDLGLTDLGLTDLGLTDKAILKQAMPIADALLRRLLIEKDTVTKSPALSNHNAQLLEQYRQLIRFNRARLANLGRHDGTNARQDHLSLAPHYADNFLACLASLPLEQREVLILVVLEDLAYPQVADCLGISLGLVLSRLMQARDYLTTHCKNSALQLKTMTTPAPEKPLYPVFQKSAAGGKSAQKTRTTSAKTSKASKPVSQTPDLPENALPEVHYKKTTVPYLRIVT